MNGKGGGGGGGRGVSCEACDSMYFSLCCSLSMNLDLEAVLKEAERLFYKYCRLTITRGFNEVHI